MEKTMRTKVIFVVYKIFTVEGKEQLEEVLDFSLDREVAEKIAELSTKNGFPAKVQKELGCSDNNESEMFIVKNENPLSLNKAKQLKDFENHVIQNMSGFDKRVLLAAGKLKI